MDLLDIYVRKSGIVRKHCLLIRETPNPLSGLRPLLHEVIVDHLPHPVEVALVEAFEEPLDLEAVTLVGHLNPLSLDPEPADSGLFGQYKSEKTVPSGSLSNTQLQPIDISVDLQRRAEREGLRSLMANYRA